MSEKIGICSECGLPVFENQNYDEVLEGEFTHTKCLYDKYADNDEDEDDDIDIDYENE